MPRLLTLSFVTLALLLAGRTAAQDLPLPGADAFGDSGSAPWPNVYTDNLAEQLVERGAAELAAGSPAQATRSLLEAIQTIKVNHGLHSTRQIPVLELLIKSQLALGDWAAVDAHVDYFEWLNERNYRNDLDAYLEGTHALSDLLLSASADRNNPVAVRYLIQAKTLNWRAVTAIEATLGKDSPRLAPWFYRLSLNHYYQASLIRRRHLTNYAFKTDGDEVISGWSMPYNESVDMSYGIGRELLQRIADLHSGVDGATTEAAALARVHQGDWELLFDRDDRALAFYERAYSDLREMGWSAMAADRYFDRPVVLPASEMVTAVDRPALAGASRTAEVTAWSPLYPGVALPSPRLAQPGNSGELFTVRARLDLLPVDSGAKAVIPATGFNPVQHNLTLLASEPDDARIRELAMERLRLLQLRPRLRAGAPAVLEDVEILYHFTPQRELTSLNANPEVP